MSAQLRDIQMAGRVEWRNDNSAIAENLACRFLESISTRDSKYHAFAFDFPQLMIMEICARCDISYSRTHTRLFSGLRNRCAISFAYPDVRMEIHEAETSLAGFETARP